MKSIFKDWDHALEVKYNPAFQGTFGLGGGGAGSTGGQANDGGAGPGGMDDAGGGGGGDYDDGDPFGGPVNPDHGYDGDGEPGYNDGRSGRSGSSGGGGGGHHDPLADLFGFLAEAEARAAKVVEEAVAKAEAAITEGRDDAAAHIIKRAKLAADRVLRAEKRSEAQLNRFWNITNQALTPFIRRGNFADREIASMLGIPDDTGKIRPFDLAKLEATPGYQWQFRQGEKAVQNSAVGTALSGAHGKALTEYGQGMAQTSFKDRITYLNELGTRGLDAAKKKGDLAYGFGTAFSDMYTTNSKTLADVHTAAGAGLGDVYSTAGGQLGDIYMRGAETRVGLITGLATAGANLQMAQIGANATLEAARIGAENQRSNSRSSLLGTIGGFIGTAVGGPILGAVGSRIGSAISGSDDERLVG